MSPRSSEPLRLCIVTSSLPTAEDPMPGAMIPHFAAELRGLGTEVLIFAPYKPGHPLVPSNIPLHLFGRGHTLATAFAHLNILDPREILKAWHLVTSGGPELLDLCLRERIDACLACWAIPAGFWCRYVLRKSGIPYAVWSLGSDIHTWGRQPLVRSVIRQILRDAAICYADGLSLAEEMSRLARRPAAYLASTTPVQRRPPSSRTKRGPYRFLFAGRWEKVKGVDILFAAFDPFFRETDRPAEIHLVGDGSLRPRLQASITSAPWKDQVHIHGVVERSGLERLMASCDCLVIPSRRESLPYVFSEALQAGMDIIATEAGDMGRLLRDYDAGIAVPVADPRALADAMLRRLRLGRSHRFEQGRRRLLKLFDLRRSARRFLSDITARVRPS